MEHVTLTELLAATGGVAAGLDRPAVGFDALEIDSRKVRPGDLFWAIAGERHDGHDFVDDALAAGAQAAVVSEAKRHVTRGPRIIVPDTLQALWNFCRRYRIAQEALVIGVTGSVGKTTTREMIHATLYADFHGVRSPANYNNHVGVPLSLLEIHRKHEFAVLELGASHVGEIKQLAEVALPEVGVLTAVSEAHLEGFGSLSGVMQGKGELLEALPKSGFAVLNGDDPHLRELSQRAPCPVIFVGEGENNHLRATDVACQPNRVSFSTEGTRYEIRATGRHHVSAALCAVAIGREIGMEVESIQAGLSHFRPAPGRCQLEEIGPWMVIDDTYNANPASMLAASRVMRDWTGPGKRVLVAGDMLELGQESANLHHRLGRLLAEAHLDHLIAFGNFAIDVVDGARSAGVPVHRLADCNSLDAVLTVLDCWLQPGDLLLIKGSRGMRMERVVDWLRGRAAHWNKEQTLPVLTTRACA